MKISRLQIKNFLGIEDMTIEPSKVTIIKGENAQGKTTILEALEKAFINKDRRPRVIRDGADRALILVETDAGLTVRRSITQKGTNLTVKDEKGFNAPSPQKLLTGLTGQFNFNPIDFLNETEKEQARIILSVADIKLTPEDVKAWTGEEPPANIDYSLHGLQVVRDLHAAYYEERREVNAEVKVHKTTMDTIDIPEGFNPEEYRNINLRSLYNELKGAQDNNELVAKTIGSIKTLNRKAVATKEKADTEALSARSQLEAGKEALGEKMIAAREKAEAESQKQKELMQLEIKALENDLKRLKESLGKEDGHLEAEVANINKSWEEQLKMLSRNTKEQLARLESDFQEDMKQIEQERRDCEAILEKHHIIDTTSLEQKIQEFQEMQSLVGDYDRREAARVAMERGKKKAKRLDTVVRLLANKPAELVAGANLPIKGLSVDNEGNVTINGRPVKSLSTSEQIRIALEIAKATAGQLKLICVDGFESIVGKSRKEFLEQIQKDDYQYFITEAVPCEVEIITT